MSASQSGFWYPCSFSVDPTVFHWWERVLWQKADVPAAPCNQTNMLTLCSQVFGRASRLKTQKSPCNSDAVCWIVRIGDIHQAFESQMHFPFRLKVCLQFIKKSTIEAFTLLSTQQEWRIKILQAVNLKPFLNP